MPITILGTVVHQQKSGTDAEIIALSGVEHGQLYLSNDSNKIWIGNRDGSLKLITNDYNELINKPTIPSQFWMLQTDGKLVPNLYSRIISTNVEDSGYGSVALIPSGTAADPGYLGFYNSAGSTIGFIGGVGTMMYYRSVVGNHYFSAAPVQIETMPQNESAPYLVVTDSSHVLQLKDINSISLWKYEPVSGNLVPKNIFATIATNREDSGYGGVRFIPGGVGLTGRIEFFRNDNTRIGFIGYDYTDVWYLSDLGNHVFKTGSVVIENILTDNALAEVLVPTSTGIIKKRTIASLGIPTQLWTESSNRIQPLNSDRISTRTGSKGYVEIFSNGSSNSGTIALYTATDTNIFSIHSADGVDTTINSPNSTNYDVGVGKSHNFTGAVKLNTLDTSTTTSYLTEDNGVIKKRSLHVATNSVVGGVRIATGGGLSVDGTGFLRIASWNDYLYTTLSSDATKSTVAFSDLLTISLPSAGVWEVKLIGGYSVTSTSNMLGVNFSCTGAVNYMIGSAQAGLTDNPANSETTKVLTATSSGMNISGITVANVTLYVNASYIINVNEPCDIKFQYASIAGGDVTVKQGTSFIAKKLNNYAP